MAKLIYLTDKAKAQLMQKFIEKLDNSKSAEGRISVSQELDSVKTEPATLRIADKAYLKMVYLIDSYKGEVGWFGFVNRISEREFEVYDIAVYPQTVSGATVNTDEKDLGEWENELTDEQYMKKRFHGHSHVNFSPEPSGVDISDRNQKLSLIGDDDYYIFMIMNKRREYSAAIFDIANNIQYETDDIDVVVSEEIENFMDSLNAVKEQFSYAGPATKGGNDTREKFKKMYDGSYYEQWY